jgi:GNAT superfamily N-acetyltransferase
VPTLQNICLNQRIQLLYIARIDEFMRMILEDLSNVPNYELPPAFSFKWYVLGDEQSWLEIQQSADRYNQISLDLFRQQFGDDLERLREGQCFILDAKQRSIGTATAWFDRSYFGKEYGRIHWVAIIPEMQGQGLAKPLMTCVCQRLQEMGHNRAYLTTSVERIAAINLYLKFGFRPQIQNDEESIDWKKIEKKLDRSIIS